MRPEEEEDEVLEWFSIRCGSCEEEGWRVVMGRAVAGSRLVVDGDDEDGLKSD